MDKITQDMKYRQSLMQYAQRHGVAKASRKYNKCKSYIHFWLNRYDGSLESLACRSRRPHSHPNAHTEEELTLIRNLRRRNPEMGLNELWFRLRQRGYRRCLLSLYRVLQRLGLSKPPKHKKQYKPKPYEQMRYPGQRVQIDVKVVPARCRTDRTLRLFQYTAIDECTRLRYLGAYEEQSTYSSADFLLKTVAFYRHNGIEVECVQTDNGFEFTNRFSSSQRELTSLFESTASRLGIRHKLIRPYTPRHNGKVERSHREDQKRLYDRRSFFSLADFGAQLAGHQSRSNNIPMRPLGWLSPKQFLASLAVQYV
jgi:transposase